MHHALRGATPDAAPRIVSMLVKTALHKNRPLHKVLCSGLWLCFKGQAVVLAPDSGAPLEPDDGLLCASYTSLVISQFRE